MTERLMLSSVLFSLALRPTFHSSLAEVHVPFFQDTHTHTQSHSLPSADAPRISLTDGGPPTHLHPHPFSQFAHILFSGMSPFSVAMQQMH